MADTPFFPSWRAWFHRRPGPGLPATVAGLRRCTLDKLEERLGPLLAGLDALDPAQASARERPYAVRRTWWCFLWQMLQLNVSSTVGRPSRTNMAWSCRTTDRHETLSCSICHRKHHQVRRTA